MKVEELVDDLAEQLYLFRYGITPEDEEKITGKPGKLWKIRYKFQEGRELVEEHEKDDYRSMTRRLLERMNHLKLIDFVVQKGEP